jgi:hypothetical protein
MLPSLVYALEQERRSPFKPCDRCGNVCGLRLVSLDGKRILCLRCFKEEYPGLYSGLYRWCQDHPPVGVKK